MTIFRKPGETVALRGIYNQHVWIAQSAVVVKDAEEEVALALLPGMECAMPEGYINGKHGPSGVWDRWGDYLSDKRNLHKITWQTNHLLMLLEPGKYYSTIYFWQHDSNQFLGYYINFQLPFVRTTCGFDTLDLELDIDIKPSYEWHWKDQKEYQDGIARGVLIKEWTNAVEAAQNEIFERIKSRQYPLDGKWLDWKPDTNWSTTKLPANWNVI